VLVSAADSAQLLVVGSRGQGAIRGLLLGSVALGCVVHAPGPVLVVPPPPRPAPAAAAAAPALAHT
jgi:nucleotide-binding universal stress UspA family protein